jgi:drug/metabolite transporter (DMT)-like permease
VWLVLLLGVLAVSTAAIFIRLAMASAGAQGIGFSIFLAATRLGLAALVLIPIWGEIARVEYCRSAYGYAIAAGVALALHFSLWISSLSFISIAASTSLVTTNPIWVALIAWFWLGERLTRRMVWGIGLGVLGSLLVAWGDGSSSGDIAGTNAAPWLGSLLALVGSWLVSFYLLWGREAQKRGLTLQHYVAIAYSTAAILLLPLPLLFGIHYVGYPLATYGYIAAMTAIAQLFGHTSLNWAMRWLPPVAVTLVILLEPIGSSLLGFIFLGEIPSLSVILGGSIIFLGVAIAVLPTRTSSSSEIKK